MNSKQISDILRTNYYSRRYFIGVFSADTMPENITHYPCSFVCNTKKSTHPGEHWLAFFIPRQDCLEIFDSLARDLPNSIEKYMKRYNNVKRNRKKFQSDFETSCGSHVIFFLIKRSMGNSFDRIMTEIGTKDFRDAFVKLFTASLT